jgi:hypothetical protein
MNKKSNENIILYTVILLFIILLTYFLFLNKKKYIESFNIYSDYSRNEILDNCEKNWAKIYNHSREVCIKNAWVSNPKYLCGICGDSESNPLYSFLPGDPSKSPEYNSKLPRLYGCSDKSKNSFGLSWNQVQPVPKVSPFLANIQTCNTFNIDMSSNLVLYVFADDKCTINVNGNVINQYGWDYVGYYFIPNIKYGTEVKIDVTNLGWIGGFCVSYIWNRQLFILDNNGFETCANIINYKVSGNTGWNNWWNESGYWNRYTLTSMPPWMKNWISIPTGVNTTGSISFKIGDSNIKSMTNDLALFVGIDDVGTVFHNNKEVLNLGAPRPGNYCHYVIIKDVKDNDNIYFKCQNLGGPGGIGFSYIWCGLLFSIPSSLEGFNASVNLINWSSDYFDLTYNTSKWGRLDNLPYLTNWINSCSGYCDFNVNIQISNKNVMEIMNLTPRWTYKPSMKNWYMLKRNNLIGNWSITNIFSNLYMTVSFWIKITKINPTWTNIFHVSNTNKDCCGVGDRNPAMWLWYNNTTFLVELDTETQGNIVNMTPNSFGSSISLNVPSFVTVVFNSPNIFGYINGKQVFSTKTDNPFNAAWPTAKFYIGDPWYPSVDGAFIKDFSIYNFPMNNAQAETLYKKNMYPN